jgi:protocatechuate 3,4-dioxygenase beta subunit
MIMHTDDTPRGALLTRRQVVALFGASAAAAMAAAASPATAQSSAATGEFLPNCVAIPQQTEGPYFVDERLLRSDLRHDPANGTMVPGAPLELRLRVAAIGAGGACAPLAGALVDIWHCDARGVYSDVRDPGFDTVGQKFLRGYQVTDDAGQVAFTTIYPGWYAGRAVHIHFKVRTPQRGGGQGSEFTSQFYFDDALTDRVFASAPYSGHRGQRLLNERDMIFREGGSRLMLPVTTTGETHSAVFNIAMQPGSAPAPGAGGRGGRPGGPPRG